MWKLKDVILYIIIPLCVIGVMIFAEKNRVYTAYESSEEIFEDIYLAKTRTSLENIMLFRNEESDVYHVYIPAGMKEEIRLFADFSGTIYLNDQKIKHGRVVSDVVEGEIYTIQVLGWRGDIVAEEKVTFYFLSDLPTCFIDTQSGDMEFVNSDKMNEEQAQYVICTDKGQVDVAGNCTVKGRGNTSWDMKQKPYSINLENAESVLGMTRTEELALLCNWGDEMPQLKNKVAYDTAQLLGLDYTPQCEFVSLYLNGKYNGLYLLSQRVNVEDNILFEFDYRCDTEINHFATMNQKVSVKSPDDISPDKLSVFCAFMQETEAAVYSEDGLNKETQKMYDEYIDVDSWAKMYLLQNYFVQWDVEFSSFYSYMADETSRLYAGPIWDFDLSCGRFYYGRYPQLANRLLWLETQGNWLKQLGEKKGFEEYVEQKFQNELEPILMKYLEEEYWEIVAEINKGVYVDSVRWSKQVNFEKHSKELYDWLISRCEFLADYYEKPETYCKVEFEFPWGTVYYYMEKGKPLEFLPLDIYGEEDIGLEYIGYSDIVGWKDESGREILVGEVVEGNVHYYSILQ